MKHIAITISIVLVIVVGSLFVLSRPDSTDTPPVGTSAPVSSQTVETQPSQSVPVKTVSTQPTQPTKPLVASYTSAQVATHASSASCWTIIGGKVYDLTSWIKAHPGGAGAILRLCGVDGTEGFTKQHGGQARPEQELAQFFIGTAK